jgi:ribokinase
MNNSPAPPRIMVVGDVVSDVLAVLAGPLAPGSDTRAAVRFTGGGQAANTAAWLGGLMVPVTLVAAVGADEAGAARLAELRAAGVDCAARQCADRATGTVIVLAHGTDRTMVSDRGANLALTAADLDAALNSAPDTRHLHLSAYPLLDAASRGAGLRALAAAHERGLTTSVDAASAEPLRQVGPAAFLRWVRGADLLLANRDEAAVLAGDQQPDDQARALSETVRNAVVKLGGDGAVFAGPGGVVTVHRSPPVPVVDATGAGDAFAAGFLAAWVTGASPREALQRAAEVAARAVSKVGARPDGPLPPPAVG